MHLLSWEVLDGHEGSLKIRLERDINVPDYAILSHRWDDPKDEVSYDDMLAGRAEGKKGYNKLLACCKQARRDGLRHAWIDTCCINKDSSAELSETINSMFAYYERSKVCYVYLSDCWIDSTDQKNLSWSSLPRSAWFTRGWTLQELIAPQHVKFFDASWSFLGWKTDKSLSAVIESVTNIDPIVLKIPATIKLMSIAKKMSWAAHRVTTRTEDRAYSLMGIFGVYMSPLYGEGNHAFIRLQEAIMRTSNDHTIFAWTSSPVRALSHGFEHVSTMLALSPEQFQYSSNFKPILRREHSKFDYAITNAGLAIRLPMQKISQVKGLYAAFLACTEGDDHIPSAILLRTTTKTPAGHFWRTNCNEGPIERSERRWLPGWGRDAVNVDDVYVLPRFTSISGDNIEPSWDRIDIAETRHGPPGSIAPESSTNMLIALRHVLDPSFSALTFLHQAHNLISTNQSDYLVDMTNTRLHCPNTIPRPRNKNFVGREAVLQQLRDTLFLNDKDLESQDKDIRSCSISGLGGIGKTEVAIEFSYDCLENHLFDAVIWIPAWNISEIQEGFRRIAVELKLGASGLSSETVFHQVLQWLYKFKQHANLQESSTSSVHAAKWLLIFDSADDVALIEPFWPVEGPGCVLVTSRQPNACLKNIIIEPFTNCESSQLLVNLTRHDWDFTALGERLGGNPLPIVETARFIVETGLSFEEYMLGLGRPENHPPDFYSAAICSFGMSRLSPMSHSVLQVMSFLNPDSIQDSVLLPSQPFSLWEAPWDETDLWQSQMDLLHAGLISKSQRGKGMLVHRLLQKQVRTNMQPKEFQQALSLAVTLVFSTWMDAKSNDTGNPPHSDVLDDLLPHVARLKDFARQMGDSEVGLSTKTDFAKLLSCVQKHSELDQVF